MSKFLKGMFAAWGVNLVIFTVSLFLGHYYDHLNHWSADAWYGVLTTSVITKICLSIAIAMYISAHGIDGLKEGGDE